MSLSQARRLQRRPPRFLTDTVIPGRSFTQCPKASFSATSLQKSPSTPPERLVYLSKEPVALPPSLEPLDLPPVHYSLPNLRDAFLSHISEMENKLDSSSSPNLSDALEEGAALLREGVEFMEWLYAELGTHIPEFDFDFEFPDIDNAIAGVRSKLPDLPNVASRLPDFDFDVRSKLERFGNRFDNARERLSHLDLTLPSLPDAQEYKATLQERLSAIRDVLSDISLPSPADLSIPSLPTPKSLTELLPDILREAAESEPEDVAERTKLEVERALLVARGGAKYITYDDLPHKWKNNEHIIAGYRFIPISSWKTLLASILHLHNETVNIHTHLLPLLSIIFVAASLSDFVPPYIQQLIPFPSSRIPTLFSPTSILEVDPVPRYLFIIAAATCLTCSSLWHISTGCSNVRVLETGARTDYVGIGWLISASVATCVYYGFQCNQTLLYGYIGLSCLTALAGSIAPFQQWFDQRKNKGKRIAFFLVLAGSSVVPILHIGYDKGWTAAARFVAPIAPSILSYLTGLTFYATQFPECFFPGRFDHGGSHAIWHLFIVWAIRLHWNAVQTFQGHVEGQLCNA